MSTDRLGCRGHDPTCPSSRSHVLPSPPFPSRAFTLPSSQCLYPLELPREALFQPYGMQQQMLASRAAIGSATPPGPSPTPTNAVASSSRTRTAASSADLFYHTPTGFLQIAYPDPEERHLVSVLFWTMSTAVCENLKLTYSCCRAALASFATSDLPLPLLALQMGRRSPSLVASVNAQLDRRHPSSHP